MTRNLGTILLAIWLIVGGLIVIVGLTFSGLAVAMAVLAIVAGILLLIGR